MKIKFITNGNLNGWAIFLFIVTGITMFYSGLAFHSLPKLVAILLVVIGLPVSAIGGYAARAKALGLKPFDNSYKKARDSYKTKDGDEDTK
jgi:hypothetical protein